MAPTAPELTFTREVAMAVDVEYRLAKVILEYGTGGSTVLAAKSGALTFAVESDKDWARNMATYLKQAYPNAPVHIHHADIGPTRVWGHPETRREEDHDKYLRYSRSVWGRADFQHPDVVLVDGRFRIGCFLATLERIRRPTRLLFDDYNPRKFYHWVERYGPPRDRIGRMAVFELEPRDFSEQELKRHENAAIKPN